jgi:hypothetical protein
MKNLILVLSAIFCLGFFQSCEKELEPQNEENVVAPKIPPVEMQRIPTTNIRSLNPETNPVEVNGVSYRNWLHAGLSVLVWHTVVVVNMAVPTAAFATAFNEEPEYIGNYTFEWSYVYEALPSEGGKTYEVVLTGQFISDYTEVVWVMNASESGGFTDFVWYTGVTSTDNTYGEFTLYGNPTDPEKQVHLEFEQSSDETNSRLRFTNVVPGSPDNGHYIEYRNNANSELNASFDIYGGPGNILEASWNEPAGNGQVRHPQYFNDNEWHCWDTNQMDIEC